MKLFFITTNYSIYLSFLLLFVVSSAVTAQSQQVNKNTPTTDLQITLPHIELMEERVVITWMTQGEKDLDLFVVQRSLDGKQWEQLVAFAAAGNTDEQQIYQTTDSKPYEGESYYRVGQIDFDGIEAFTKKQEVVYEVPMERFFSAQYLKAN